MKIVFALMMTLTTLSTWAQDEVSKVISRSEVEAVVKVSASTVRCSALGYGRPELKIDVPALDWAASFNHRTFGEGQPCMTSVVCHGDNGPQLLLAQGEAEVPVKLIVTHSEKAWLNREDGTCFRQLVEDVEMDLRGLKFKHQRSGNLAEASAEACETLLQ